MSGSLNPPEGPTPSGDKHGGGCGPRSCRTAYLDKMQIKSCPPPLVSLALSVSGQNLGTVPWISARAEESGLP